MFGPYLDSIDTDIEREGYIIAVKGLKLAVALFARNVVAGCVAMELVGISRAEATASLIAPKLRT
jgi:hypothetical protein